MTNKRSSMSPKDMGHRNTNGKKDPKTGSPMPQNYDNQMGGMGFTGRQSTPIPTATPPGDKRNLMNPGPQKPAAMGTKGQRNPADNMPASGLNTGAFDTQVHNEQLNPNPLPKPRPIKGEWPGGGTKPGKQPKGGTTGGGN